MNGNLQYIDDSFLIERTLKALSALEESDGIKKVSFDLSSLLQSAESTIKSTLQSQVHDDSHGGMLRTVIDLLTPAMFFRLFPGNPLIAVLSALAEVLGIDLYTIFEKIVSPIIGKLKSGQKVSAQEVNDAGKASIPTEQTANASDDLLDSMRELDSRLTKKAGRYNPNILTDFVKQLSESQGTKNSSPLVRAFSFLSPQRKGHLFVGILVWLIKTFLISGGLLVGASLLTGALGMGKHTNAPTEQGQTGTQTPPTEPVAKEKTVPTPIRPA